MLCFPIFFPICRIVKRMNSLPGVLGVFEGKTTAWLFLSCFSPASAFWAAFFLSNSSSCLAILFIRCARETILANFEPIRAALWPDTPPPFMVAVVTGLKPTLSRHLLTSFSSILNEVGGWLDDFGCWVLIDRFSSVLSTIWDRSMTKKRASTHE